LLASASVRRFVTDIKTTVYRTFPVKYYCYTDWTLKVFYVFIIFYSEYTMVLEYSVGQGLPVECTVDWVLIISQTYSGALIKPRQLDLLLYRGL
jgi:hypothetical protein